MDRCEFTDCGHELPIRSDRCPHCGRPGLFPNVRVASQPTELVALDGRYQDTRRAIDARGCAGVADAFMEKVDASTAVITRPLGDVERLARNDHEVYSTYYKQIEAEIRLPDDSKWDPLRRIAEEALFPGYKENIRFAALTLEDRGLPSYGDCFFTLRSPMIAHRSSVFETNNVLFMKQRNLSLGEMADLPLGYRANWKDRAKLCIAKLGARLDQNMKDPDFSALLMCTGSSTNDDDFVEVHIFGPITIRSIRKIVLTKPDVGRVARAKRRAWGEKLLKRYGVVLEVT
jgi:hypothetical protein